MTDKVYKQQSSKVSKFIQNNVSKLCFVQTLFILNFVKKDFVTWLNLVKSKLFELCYSSERRELRKCNFESPQQHITTYLLRTSATDLYILNIAEVRTNNAHAHL